MSRLRRSCERRAVSACAVVIVIACSDAAAPATPEPGVPASITPETPASIAPGPQVDMVSLALAQPVSRGPVAPAVEDATDRLAASLAHLGPAVELRRTLQRLAGALSGSDREQSARLAAQARPLLARLGSSLESSGIGPELSAIELALDAAERELEASNAVDNR